MVTEARALDDLYQRRSGAAGLDRRAQIRKVLKPQIYWPPRVFMLADSLTKRLGNSQLTRLVMALGLYGLGKETLERLLCTDLEQHAGGCETHHGGLLIPFSLLSFTFGHAPASKPLGRMPRQAP